MSGLRPAFSPAAPPAPKVGRCGGGKGDTALPTSTFPPRQDSSSVAPGTGGFARPGASCGPRRPSIRVRSVLAGTPQTACAHRRAIEAWPGATHLTRGAHQEQPGSIPVVRTSPQRDVAVVSPCLRIELSATCHLHAGGRLRPRLPPLRPSSGKGSPWLPSRTRLLLPAPRRAPGNATTPPAASAPRPRCPPSVPLG